MDEPLQITFRHMPPSTAMEERIRTLAARLQQTGARILACHVVVEAPHQHHRQGNLFDIRIDIKVPGAEFSLQRAHSHDQAYEDPYVALRDLFRAARRRLQGHEREHRHSVHRP